MIEAKIIADSVNPCGNRITTWVLTYPRFIHSELMTHRAFSRNAASSRAIPVQKMIDAVWNNTAGPEHWGAQQRGMQADNQIHPDKIPYAIAAWDDAMRDAVRHAKSLLELGVHKQVANRLLEPFSHMTTLVTATDMDNFFALRAHKDAQPEFQILAFKMLELYNSSTPTQLAAGEWHIPFGDRMPEWIEEDCPVDADEARKCMVVSHKITLEERLMIATARAARVSYLTFEGDIDFRKDFALHNDLSTSGHWSPFEHCAQAMAFPARSGNFFGWKQYRQTFKNQNRIDDRIKKYHNNSSLHPESGYIAFDLDGTLVRTDGWVEAIGRPIPEVFNLMKEYREAGYPVRVLTARGGDPEQVALVKEWLRENGMDDVQVQNFKDYGMLALYDDRAINVGCNTGKIQDCQLHRELTDSLSWVK